MTETELTSRMLALTTGLLLAFTAAFFLYYGLNTMNDAVFSIDFVPYHLAGQLLARGDLVHLTNYAESGGFFATSGPFLETFHQYFYPQSTYATRWVYLPAYLWVFRPLAGFDFPAASRIWLAINAILTLACLWLLWSARRLTNLSPQLKYCRLAWYAFLVLTFQPMLSNLWHGQVTALIIACFCLSYWLLKREHLFFTGCALGLIVPFKFYPALFLIYFAWRRQWRVVAGAILASLLLLLISLLTVGWKANLAYFQVVLSELSSGGIPAFNNQSISGFLLHIFTSGDVFAWLDVKVPLWITGLRLILVLSLVGGVVWVMRRPYSFKSKAVDKHDLDISLVIFVMLLISPITWYHYYLWLLLPIMVLFDWLLLDSQVSLQQIAWFALAYGLIVVEGVIVLRPLAQQSLQNVWVLRFLLSQSFFGAVLLLGLTIWSRLRLGEDS